MIPHEWVLGPDETIVGWEARIRGMGLDPVDVRAQIRTRIKDFDQGIVDLWDAMKGDLDYVQSELRAHLKEVSTDRPGLGPQEPVSDG